MRPLFLAIAASLLCAVPAAAQRADSSAVLAGYVAEMRADTVVRALEGTVVIDLLSKRSATTNAHGAYRLENIPAGLRLVTVRKLGYQPLTTSVELAAHEVNDFDVRLARGANVLDTIVVRGRRVTIEGPKAFRERVAHGMGDYVTHEDIERMQAIDARDVLIHSPGVRVDSRTGTPYAPRAHYAAAGGARCSSMVVLLDGMRMTDTDMRNIPASMIAGIEVYTSAATTPPHLVIGGSMCGTIAIWTR